MWLVDQNLFRDPPKFHCFLPALKLLDHQVVFQVELFCLMLQVQQKRGCLSGIQ